MDPLLAARLADARARVEPVVGRASSWLLDNVDLISPRATVLDVASGRGRHALLLAALGCHVTAIDRDRDKLDDLIASAAALQLAIAIQCRDLEADAVDLGCERYDTIIVFNYLHRPLMPSLQAALSPGGVLIYETFTVGQAARGHPRNRAFLLADGELPQLVAPLDVLRSREGEFEGKSIAAVVARKRAVM